MRVRSDIEGILARATGGASSPERRSLEGSRFAGRGLGCLGHASAWDWSGGLTGASAKRSTARSPGHDEGPESDQTPGPLSG
ncbi:hypothetical protein DUHN55_46270 [Helicobacter pylori]